VEIVSHVADSCLKTIFALLPTTDPGTARADQQPNTVGAFMRLQLTGMGRVLESSVVPQDQNRWLHITRVEILAALDRPHDRLLDAYVAAHPETLKAGKCPSDTAP